MKRAMTKAVPTYTEGYFMNKYEDDEEEAQLCENIDIWQRLLATRTDDPQRVQASAERRPVGQTSYVDLVPPRPSRSLSFFTEQRQ